METYPGQVWLRRAWLRPHRPEAGPFKELGEAVGTDGEERPETVRVMEGLAFGGIEGGWGGHVAR